MRWDFVDRIPRLGRQSASNLFAQSPQFFVQLIDLLLLAVDRAIEFFEQLFAIAQFHFDFGKSGFHVGSWYGVTSLARRLPAPRHTVLTARILAVLWRAAQGGRPGFRSEKTVIYLIYLRGFVAKSAAGAARILRFGLAPSQS